MRLQLKYSVGTALFFIAGIAALLLENPLFIAVPFLFVLFYPISQIVFFKIEWIFYALLALLPLSTEINLTPALGLDFPAEVLMMLLTGIFLVKLTHQPTLLPKSITDQPLFFLMVLHLCWILVATILSSDPFLSFKFLLAKTWFIVPFVLMPFWFLRTKKHFRLCAFLLVIPMALVVVQALIRHSLLNFSFDSVKEIYDPFFRNHVNFAAMLVCLLAIIFCIYRLTPSSHPHKKILLLSLIVGFVALVLAFSRGGWVALFLGILSLWFFKKQVIGKAIILGIVLIGFSMIYLLKDNKYLEFAPDYNTTIFHSNFNEHLAATVAFKDVSNAERFYRWIAGVNMIAAKPVNGFGPNNFYNNYRSYTETPFKTWVSNNPEHSTVHNYFLLTAIEQGIPGLLFFCLLYFGMIMQAQKLFYQLQDSFYKQVALTVGVILVMIGALIFMSDLIETDKIGSLFWLCLGVLLVLQQKTQNVEEG